MSIIIGYQGIGKSTLAQSQAYRYIDLDPSNFFVDGKRDFHWYKPYCQMAMYLSEQGFHVFVSSHQVVRDYLKILSENSQEDIFVCFPDYDLRDAWIEKLEKRYEQTGTEKDYKTWQNAKMCFDLSIDSFYESLFEHIVIEKMDYDLHSMLAEALEGQTYI